MAGPVPLERLRRRRRLVTCPACRQTAQTIHIREPYRNVECVVLQIPVYKHLFSMELVLMYGPQHFLDDMDQHSSISYI
jgi:hypothetical protein